MSSSLRTGRFLALFSSLAIAATAQVAPSFHLAYAVDTQVLAPNGTDPNPTYNQVRIRDHHVDHYHNFTNNAGLGSHDQTPLTVTIGGGYASLSLGAWNYSPDAAAGRYTIPDDGAGAHFHLALISVTGPDANAADALNIGVGEVGDFSFSPLTVGGDAHLDFGATFNEVAFSFETGAAVGNYIAVFQLVDEAGLYLDSAPFSIHVNAVSAIPEPSSAAALAGFGILGLALARRRVRA